MYEEIIELKLHCDDIGVKCAIKPFFDGFVIFFQKGDVVQHYASYGSASGYVEFGFTEFDEVDFGMTSLNDAKAFVSKNKDALNAENS